MERDYASFMHAVQRQAFALFYLRSREPAKRGPPHGATRGERSQRPSRSKYAAPPRWSRSPGRPPSYAPSAQDQIDDPMWDSPDPPWSPPLDGIPGELHVELRWLRAQAARPVTPHRPEPRGWVPLWSWRRHFGVSRVSGARPTRAQHAARAARIALADMILQKLVAAGWARVRPGRTASSLQILVHPNLELAGKPSLPDDPDQDPGPWPDPT